jgi:2-oxoglutarate ferredoxin oxidoreductase subunit beta
LQANVINASIDESKLANNAVTRDKILNNSVSNEKIATGVSTEKLQQTTFADNPNALVNGEALDVSLNKIQYQAKDFSSEAEIRWCPGCGDYIILKQLQMALAKSGSIPHQTAVISGIGCSSRLPYYMNTYGFHTIHGRALPIATGLKKTNPELEVWVATGDGDSLSIGTNHFVHCLRRDIDINIILFNNKIYGLTKGQYSPTSDLGQYSKSTPQGSEEAPLNVMELALASGAKFIARSADRFASHLQEVFIKSKNHYGTSFVEVLQNCPIFNDGIFDIYTQKDQSKNNIIFLEEGSPIVFGNNNDLTIVIENLKPKITKGGYLQIGLTINKKRKWMLVIPDID